MRIGPACDIARCVNSGNAGFEIGIHGNSALQCKTGLLGQAEPRTHADADDHNVGLQYTAAFERRALAVVGDHGISEMEDDAVLFVQRSHEVPHFGPKHALHRSLLGRNDVDLDISRTQCRRGLKADEAGTDHDCAAGAVQRLDDRPAIRKRAQRMDMRLVSARDRQPHWLCTCREQ